jgi:polysaccharide deacetylase 2 family uncharacterized protein YibQ
VRPGCGRWIPPSSRRAPARSIVSSPLRSRSRFRPGSLCLAIAVLLLAGCAKESLSKSELRGVTEEIVASAQKITAHKSGITIRPQMQPPKAGGAGQAAVDLIYVSLSDPSQEQPFEESLSAIARRHKLSTTEAASGGVVVIDFAFRGTRTHSVRVVTSSATRTGPPVSADRGAPRLAIILDDLGHDRASAESLLALPFPLTVSVIPHLPYSSEVAEEAFRHGDEVLLHLPMESESEAKQEGIELRVGMNSEQVESALAAMLATVPHAVGVNNHQGSRATADPALMEELMPALRQRGLFFIDSRTTTATVAYNVAESSGVRAASRKVFLDDTPTKEAVRAQINLAARDAARDGFAIAIGHPHPATLAALGEMAPQLESRGIRLVFASNVVR